MKETQKEKVLRLLRLRPQTTMDIVKGQKYMLYKLIEEPKQIALF